MFPSDSLPSELRFRQAYTLSLYLSVMGRVSPVPNHTFYTYRFLYTERFLRAASSFFTRSMVFTYMRKAQLLFALFSETFLTIRQNSLNVTVCIIARPSCRGYFIHSLSTLYYYNAPSLATRLTGDYRDRTYTGKCEKDPGFLSKPLILLFTDYISSQSVFIILKMNSNRSNYTFLIIIILRIQTEIQLYVLYSFLFF